MARANVRAGMTLIELAIVLSILGLMISLMLPAIQASRAAARRTQCQNNQRQFGLAFASFESQRGTFPAACTMWVKGPLGVDPQVRLQNFVVDLLPYMEGSTVAMNYDRDTNFFDARNATAIAAPLSIFTCTSAPEREIAPRNQFVPSLLGRPSVTRQTGFTSTVFEVLDKKYRSSYHGALTDYTVIVMTDDRLAGSLGYTIKSGALELPSMFPLPDSDEMLKGIMPLILASGEATFSRQTRAADVTDGLSNTIMLVEDAGRPERWQLGAHTGTHEPLASAWADPLILISLRETQTPNGKCLINCDNDANIYSFHAEGANVLFADGHVQFVLQDIDPKVLVAMTTPDQDDIGQ